MIKLTRTSSAKRIREAWLEALESGEYKQGKGSLHTRIQKGKKQIDSFCCLGVLCDLAVKAKVIDPPEFEDGSRLFLYEDNDSYLPLTVQEWAHIKSDNGGFVDKDGEEIDGLKNLASQNDKGAKFKTIAKLIREHEKEIFTK